jgi:deoxyribodipyrimidine photo-lyase
MRIEQERIKALNEHSINADGAYLFYWMQHSQRSQHNEALEHALDLAEEHNCGLVVGFILPKKNDDIAPRFYRFLIDGLTKLADDLKNRGIKFLAFLPDSQDLLTTAMQNGKIIVTDTGYLKEITERTNRLAQEVNLKFLSVEANIVVPVETVSDKHEYAARTIRPKIKEKRHTFVKTLSAKEPIKTSLYLNVQGDVDIAKINTSNVFGFSDSDINLTATDGDSCRFISGYHQASKKLGDFLKHGLPGYEKARNDPANPNCSELSPYLRFGQISPVEIAYRVLQSSSPSEADKEAFLEECIVRRELAINHVYYQENYDSYRCIPDWAIETLDDHKDDTRKHRYTRKQLEDAESHDEYWNAAQNEMVKTGYMHNHMRMYWGKKVLEWCNTPEYAFRTLIYLNNKYFLDGSDPNSYTNVAWIFGLHDRAWTEREIFGKVRYMNSDGLNYRRAKA